MSRAAAKIHALLFVVAATTGPAPAARSQTTPASAAGTRSEVPARPVTQPIGVVDFTKVIETYPRAIQERKKLDEFYQQRQATLEADERKAQEIRQQRDLFQKDSSEWHFKDLELRLAAQALDGKRQIFQEELRQQRETFYVAMLEDMQRAVAIVAKERGVALVLRAHNDLLNGSTESKARVFEARVVWYFAEEVDLTPAVIKLLQVPLPELPKDAQETAGSKPGEPPRTPEPDGTESHGNQQGRK